MSDAPSTVQLPQILFPVAPVQSKCCTVLPTHKEHQDPKIVFKIEQGSVFEMIKELTDEVAIKRKLLDESKQSLMCPPDVKDNCIPFNTGLGAIASLVYGVDNYEESPETKEELPLPVPFMNSSESQQKSHSSSGRHVRKISLPVPSVHLMPTPILLPCKAPSHSVLEVKTENPKPHNVEQKEVATKKSRLRIVTSDIK